MPWTNRTLVVLEEHVYKSELKYKWEIIRPEDGAGKHYAAGLAKIGYYKDKKTGETTRGYPQLLGMYDLKWIDKNRERIDAAIEAKYDAIGHTQKPAEEPPPAQGGDDTVEEVPF